MRTMYDSVNPAAIPSSASLVAGYVDGRYAWTQGDWDRFPHAVKVGIAVRPSTDDGHVLDVEQGDATPQQATGWVAMRRRAGVDPTIYCNASTWPAVRVAFAAAIVPEPHYWIADYDGSTSVPDGAVAKQYNDPPGSGGDWDISAVADYWPGVDTGGSLTQPNALTPTDQEALIWREEAEVSDSATVQGGPTKGEPNRLAQALAAIQARADANGAALAVLQASVAAIKPADPAAVAAALNPAVTSAVNGAFAASQAPTAQSVADAVVKELSQKLAAA